MAKGSGRHFRDKSRGKPQRKRKPVVLLIAEGQNKTEKLYFLSPSRQNRQEKG